MTCLYWRSSRQSLQCLLANHPVLMVFKLSIFISGYPLVLFLTGIFNAILGTGCVPVSFACGYVIPLLKSTDKDPSIPSNYKGISLTSVVGKVFERLQSSLSRLLRHWSRNKSSTVAGLGFPYMYHSATVAAVSSSMTVLAYTVRKCKAHVWFPLVGG